MTKTVNHYIDNKAFHAALVERKGLVDASKLEEKPKPQISNYLGACFLKMATNIAYKHNFNRYPYKEEMISDGLIDCIKYIDTFDVTRHNPFAYFTSAISNAFIRRIIKEKKQGYVKCQMLSTSSISIHDLQEQDEDSEYINAFRDYMAAYNNFDGSMFERKKKVPKDSIDNTSTLAEFIDIIAELQDAISLDIVHE